MDLIRIASDEPGPVEVKLSARARALIRLRTSKVQRLTEARAEIRLLGSIEPNETTLRAVTAWTGGRIDRLHVNVTGEKVRAGQVIATLYSPEIFAAHQDLVVARRQLDRMTENPGPSIQAAQAALAAARERLRLLGVPESELARMEKRSQPTRSIHIRSPFSGTVIERSATEGAYVSTGTRLYRIANLSSLWVQLDAYESDLARLSVGLPVRVSVQALAGEIFDGSIMFIDPTLNPQRRTAQVRVQVQNRDGRLRPGMFAEAVVTTARPQSDLSPLVVPASAPLFTGRRALVYVETPSEDATRKYVPRAVRLGPRMGEVYPVVAGLDEGERIVTRGAFAIDADLQIRGGPSMMTLKDEALPNVAPTNEFQLTEVERALLSSSITAYLSLQEALADDDIDKTRSAADQLRRALRKVRFAHSADARAVWRRFRSRLLNEAQRIARAPSLENARASFEPLSKGVIQVLERLGNPLDKPLRLAYCPMAAGSQGAFWIQEGEGVDNAYFGASMLTCGEIKEEIQPGASLMSSPDLEGHSTP